MIMRVVFRPSFVLLFVLPSSLFLVPPSLAENVACTTDDCMEQVYVGKLPVPSVNFTHSAGLFPSSWRSGTGLQLLENEDNVLENVEVLAGRGPVARYPVLTPSHAWSMFSHDVWAVVICGLDKTCYVQLCGNAELVGQDVWGGGVVSWALSCSSKRVA